ncbi:MAG TPA: aminotransferase class I/II-fold pyridoxal phosphate-dependent enzyme [Candidatus Baltobacteraceae bacterium]|nr:aminotransferase class I/II-fold pyridoxal phosphate-dependent enzyme [Candidatus Baltobacteraceae bacterium]
MSLPLRRAIEALPDYDPRDLSDRGIAIRLHRNEGALPPPEFVLDAIRAIDGESLRTYPTELQAEVRERIAARFSREATAVVLGNGADELLAACARIALDPGDTALCSAPSFGMYPRVVTLTGAQLRRVPYPARWRFEPLQLIEAADDRTRLVFLGHPNNPTTDPLRAGDLTAVARALPEALIVIDEVYLAFSDRSLARDALAFENVVVTGSFSKCASLAGARLGYALAAPATAAALRRCIGPYPAGALSLIAAQAYLRDPARTRAFETRLEAQTARSLDAFENAFAPFAREIWRGPANFLLADCGARATVIRDALAARGIAVRTFEDPMLAGMLRLCATTDEATDTVVRALREIAAEVVYA